MKYTISYIEGRFRQLTPKYKLLFCLHKSNTDLAKLLKGNVQQQYEYRYAVHIDSENCTLILSCIRLFSLGAASADHVEYAKVISFTTMKELLSNEISFTESLLSKCKDNNDTHRATLCKESLKELKTIANTSKDELNSLISE